MLRRKLVLRLSWITASKDFGNPEAESKINQIWELWLNLTTWCCIVPI